MLDAWFPNAVDPVDDGRWQFEVRIAIRTWPQVEEVGTEKIGSGSPMLAYGFGQRGRRWTLRGFNERFGKRIRDY